MGSQKIDKLFSDELSLYTDLDKLISTYTSSFCAEILAQIQTLQKEVANIQRQQAAEIQALCDNIDFEKEHPLFFNFINRIDFSNLEIPETKYLCYLSIYKLLRKATGQVLISNLCHHLTENQKIIMRNSKEQSIYVKEFDFYHPEIDEDNTLVVAGEQGSIIPIIDFIAFGHELIHILHRLLDFKFNTKHDFKLSDNNPKHWLYLGSFLEPELSPKPGEYATIESSRHTLNGMSENKIRADFGLPLRGAWRTVKLGDFTELDKYLYFVKKIKNGALFSTKEKLEIPLMFFDRKSRRPEKVSSAKEEENFTISQSKPLSLYSFCSIL